MQLRNSTENLFEPKRRQFLHTAVTAPLLGAALGGLAEKGIISILSETTETLPKEKPPLEVIAAFKKNEDVNKPSFLTQANTPIIGAEKFSRQEYVEHYFTTTPSKILPKKIKKTLSSVIKGLPYIESHGYNNSAKSPAGAIGIWQIMPDTFQEHANKGEKNTDIRVQTKVAFKKFEQSYQTIFTKGRFFNSGKTISPLTFRIFQEKYGFNEEQWNNFVTMTLINAYQTGEGRMLDLGTDLIKTYPSQESAKNDVNDETELGIFDLMTRLGEKNREGYEKHSKEYALKVLAGSESLSGNTLHFSNISQEKKTDEIDIPLTGMTIGAGIALFRKQIGNAFQNYIQNKKEKTSEHNTGPIKTIQESIQESIPEVKMSRRTFLELLGGLGLLGSGFVAGMKFESENEPGKESKEIKKKHEERSEKEVSKSAKKKIQPHTYSLSQKDTSHEIPEVLKGKYSTHDEAFFELNKNENAFLANRKDHHAHTRGKKKETSLEQINKASIQGLKYLREHFIKNGIITKDEILVFTGGTEDGHTEGEHSHWNGFKIDIRCVGDKEGSEVGRKMRNFLKSGKGGDIGFKEIKALNKGKWRRFEITIKGIKIIIMDENYNTSRTHLDISFLPVEK